MADPHETDVGAIFTSRVTYSGEDRVDITRKSGSVDGIALAPSWELLKPFLVKRKFGQETDDDWREYVERYTAEMRVSYRTHAWHWRRLLTRLETGPLTLVCYCRSWERCHRTVAARLLAAASKGRARYAGEAETEGERKPTGVAIVCYRGRRR